MMAFVQCRGMMVCLQCTGYIGIMVCLQCTSRYDDVLTVYK